MCADPRRFSQLITPFFASESLGIPHTPLFCLLYFLEHWSLCATNLCAFYFVCFLSQYVNELCKTVFIGVPCGPSSKSRFEKPLKIPHSTKNIQVNLMFLPSVRNRLLKVLSVENIGVEPMTSCVQGRRSSQLS